MRGGGLIAKFLDAHTDRFFFSYLRGMIVMQIAHLTGVD